MRLLAGILLAGVLLLPGAVYAQVIDPNASSSNNQLQTTGSGLQQPVAGVQGTTPQNLTPSQGTTLNQSSSSTQVLGPPSGVATITPVASKKNSSLFGQLAVAVIVIVAGALILWRMLRAEHLEMPLEELVEEPVATEVKKPKKNKKNRKKKNRR